MKKRKKRVILCFCIVVVLCVCVFTYNELGNKKSEKISRQIFAMDTVMDLTIYGSDGTEAMLEAIRLIQKMERKFSVTDTKSDIFKVNSQSGNPVVVSEETYELIKDSLKYSEQTEGALDISIYPLVKAWGFTKDKQQIPTEKERKEAMKKVDFRKIRCLDNNQIQLEKGMEIDLGAVAKGYVSQKIMELWKSKGISSGIISLGGNVQTIGKKENSSPYQVGIIDPFQTDQLFGILSVENKAVVTSGIYQRYFTQGGKQYHHIMDSQTGMPADHTLASVTVISDDGTKADALATALFVMGEEKIKKYQKNHPDIQVLYIRKDGTFWQSDQVQMTKVHN